jgi:hypothetical protein
MRILALDTASSTGFCKGDSAGEPTYGTKVFKVRNKGLGVFGLEFWDWLCPLVMEFEPELIIFEAPLLSFGRGRVRTSVAGARLMMGLCMLVELAAAKCGVRCREVHNQTIKQFMGAGKDKASMVRMVQVFGYSPQTDDEADAIAIWLLAVQYEDPKNARTLLGPLGARR